MKKLFPIFILFILSIACNDDAKPVSDKGCLTAIPKTGGQRTTIRCCTRQQFLAGDNVNAGGTSSWDLFTQHQWTAIDDCSNCH